MSDVVNLTVISSAVGNKILKPDANGYYKVVLGAFNVRNSAGAIYVFDGVPQILNDKTNHLNKRLAGGRLRAEAEHPERVGNITDEQYILRNLNISTDRACAHIKELTIKETNHSENIPGVGNVVLIEGLLKPSGNHGIGLKESLDNPEEDTCFSIRSFTNDVATSAGVVKRIIQIVTWDWVNDPGIRYASKLGSPSVESVNLGSYNVAELMVAKELSISNDTSTEANDTGRDIDALVRSCEEDDVISKWL